MRVWGPRCAPLHVEDQTGRGRERGFADQHRALWHAVQDTAPVLYSLIFGEGVVNDATSIVLLRAVQKIRWDMCGDRECVGKVCALPGCPCQAVFTHLRSGSCQPHRQTIQAG